jgi:hypothetical protein
VTTVAVADTPLEQQLAELTRLIEERFGPRAAAVKYLLTELQTLMSQSEGLGPAVALPQIELTMDQLEDVLESLGVEKWA